MQWKVDTVIDSHRRSLVPRPIPSFSMLHAASPFSAYNIPWKAGNGHGDKATQTNILSLTINCGFPIKLPSVQNNAYLVSWEVSLVFVVGEYEFPDSFPSAVHPSPNVLGPWLSIGVCPLTVAKIVAPFPLVCVPIDVGIYPKSISNIITPFTCIDNWNLIKTLAPLQCTKAIQLDNHQRLCYTYKARHCRLALSPALLFFCMKHWKVGRGWGSLVDQTTPSIALDVLHCCNTLSAAEGEVWSTRLGIRVDANVDFINNS